MGSVCKRVVLYIVGVYIPEVESRVECKKNALIIDFHAFSLGSNYIKAEQVWKLKIENW